LVYPEDELVEEGKLIVVNSTPLISLSFVNNTEILIHIKIHT